MDRLLQLDAIISRDLADNILRRARSFGVAVVL
jgi:hypothetical protein